MIRDPKLLVLSDYLQENGFGWVAELLAERELVYAQLRRLETFVSREDDDRCACNCREAHSPRCELGRVLRLTGGPKEVARQLAGAHRQALSIDTLLYETRDLPDDRLLPSERVIRAEIRQAGFVQRAAAQPAYVEPYDRDHDVEE